MSHAVVVDTGVVSYLFKSQPIAFQYIPDPKDRTPVLCFMTLAEKSVGHRYAPMAAGSSAPQAREPDAG